MTIVEKIQEHAKKHPEKLAVIFEDSTVSYGELWQKTCGFAKRLSDLGVKKGDPVIVQAAYSKWYIVACYGCHLSGAIFVPVDKNANESMIRDIYGNVSAKYAVASVSPEGCDTLLYSELENTLETVPSDWKFAFPTEDMVADMMFTTGTTGTPKGVVLSHRNLTQTVLTRMAEIHVKEDNVGVTLVPLNHVAPMRELYLNGYVGGSFIFLDGITKMKKMFSMMEEYKVTSLYLPPANISVIQQISKDSLHSFADQIDYVYTGSAAMQEAQQDFMRRMLPNSRLYFSYGSSENGSVCLHRYDRDKKPITCVGKPCVGVDVKLQGDGENEVKAGEPGIVTIKSEMNMVGYWRRDDLNESVFQNGYFISNDVGFFDEEGFLYITGRKDDIINIGGLKVYPSEIENAVLMIKGIEDCVCYSIPDNLTGQAAKLLLQLSEDFTGDLRTIREELSNRLDSYKIPRVIEFVDTIQRTSNGKVDRKYYKNSENAKH